MNTELVFKELFDVEGRDLTENDIVGIMHWLYDSGIDIEDQEEINDNHYEVSWDDMFNWIHEEKTPSQIKRQSYNVNDYINVYVCEDKSCIFFYGIG